MRSVKMFYKNELEEAIGALDCVGEDAVISFLVESSEEADPTLKLLNDYFLEHGCQPDEEVYINIT